MNTPVSSQWAAQTGNPVGADSNFQNSIEQRHLKHLSGHLGLEIDSIEFRVGNLPGSNFIVFELFVMEKSLQVARAVIDGNGRVLVTEEFFTDESKVNKKALESIYSTLAPICSIIKNKEPAAGQYECIFMEGTVSKQKLALEEPELTTAYRGHRIEEIVKNMSFYDAKNFI